LIWIMFGAEWWWWGAKLSWFAKIQKWHNLESALMFQLCLSITLNPERVCRDGLDQSCSSWWDLGWGAKSWNFLVYKSLNTEAQNGHHDKNGRFDHYLMWSIWIQIWFDLSFFDSKGVLKCLVTFSNQWHKPNWPRLSIFKNGQNHMWGFLWFLSFIPFFLFCFSLWSQGIKGRVLVHWQELQTHTMAMSHNNAQLLCIALYANKSFC
jgi:hypothetical protein